MRAFVLVPEERELLYPSADRIKAMLAEKGVVYGLSDRAIATMSAMRICGKKIEIARGKPSVPGVSGQLEVLVDVSAKGKPRELENGSVDHHDIGYVINVKEGTSLVRRIPPRPGKDGRTVMGRTLGAPPVSDVKLPRGVGTALSPDDPNLLVAADDGALVVTSQGLYEVRTSKVIHGDVDYSTGNVTFTGDLTITGAVRGGFSAQATGNIAVKGGVENAQVKCGGNLLVLGVAAGSGKGTLECGGLMKLRHIERLSAKAGKEVIVSEDAIHSDLKAREAVRVKNLIGGTAFADVAIEVGTSGNESEVVTVLHIGGLLALQDRKRACLKEIAQIAGAVGVLKQTMYTIVKEGMNAAGELGAEDKERLEELLKEREGSELKVQEHEGEIEAIQKEISDFPPSYISGKTLHPGTVVRFGAAQKRIDHITRNVKITASDDQIVFDRM